MSDEQDASRLTRHMAGRLREAMQAPPSVRQLELALRDLAKWRSQLIANTLKARGGTVLPHGPFAGMHYAVAASEGAAAPRMLGLYEHALAPVIEEIVARAYPLVVDVGCAEGYYAVGLARRMPGSRVIARDMDPAAREACAALARANGVSHRIEVGGLFGAADFDIAMTADTVVICDIEGAEDALLDPETAPGLLHADIHVEAHDCFRPGLADRLTERFAPSHEVRRIGRSLAFDGLPDWMESLSDLDRLLALWEWRAGPTPWLWMTRRARG
jgi:SAM-dependent methyltransferase